MTEQQYFDWLDSTTATRMVLVEVDVRANGVETTRYLSTAPYVTSAGDTPANQPYSAILMADDIVTNEQLSTSGEPSMTVGEVGLDNTDGSLDDWLLDVWTNRSVKIYLGDPTWPRADFQLVFSGVTANIGSKSRTSLNLKIRDKLQRLNGAISEVKLGGETDNKDALLPLLLGEAHNITPLLTNPATLEYQVHIGEAERIVEVRDNGVPVAFTPLPLLGKFRVNQSPAGDVTVTAQGVKPEGVYRNTVAHLVQHLAVAYGKAEDRFSTTHQLAPGTYPYTATPLFKSFARASIATYEKADGTIATAAAGVPRIGKDGLVIEAAATNLLLYSTQFDAVGWGLGGSGTVTVTANYASAPDNTLTADRLVFSGPNVAWGRGSSLATGTTCSGSVFIRGQAGQTICIASGGVDEIFTLTGSWQRVESNNKVALDGAFNINTYNGATARDVVVWGAQLEAAPTVSSYIPTTGATVTRAADTMVVYSEVDGPNFAAFDAANQQPVGLPVPDRTNVLAACQQLAASVGAQTTVSRLGQLQLHRIDLQSLVPTFSIGPQHMRERALTIAAHADVKAAVKLGFCKNWTMQPGLQTSLPAAHKEMFNTEWLTSTKVDESVRLIYRLTAEPVQEDTLLLRRIDADAEAQRRLELHKQPRTTFQFEGYAPMLRLRIGQAVQLTHPRFNLESGKVGMVVSMSVRWARARATVGVMI